MKIGQNLIRKFQDGGAVYAPTSDYQNPYNFALYNYLSGLSGQEFADAMQANFGMVTGMTEDDTPLDYSMLFSQYDDLAQGDLRDTYTSAVGKAERKAGDTLSEAFRLSRSGKQGFGGIGSSLREAFNRAFKTRNEAGSLAQAQLESGTFDLQSDYTSEFEDLLAQLSAQGVEFTGETDPNWEGSCEGDQIWDAATASCVDPTPPTTTCDDVSADNYGAIGDCTYTDPNPDPDPDPTGGGSGGSGGSGGTNYPDCPAGQSWSPSANSCITPVEGSGEWDQDDSSQAISGPVVGSTPGGSFGGYNVFGGQ